MYRFATVSVLAWSLVGCSGFRGAVNDSSSSSPSGEQLFSASASPSVGSIQGLALGSPLVISAGSRTAGAIDSLTWNGVEFIDSLDHGRELQSASSYDDAGECLNPTEAGSSRDSAGPRSTSRLLGLRASGNVLATTTQAAYWVPANAAYTDASQCGARADLHHALNQTDVSNDLISKNVTIGFGGFDNAIEYLSAFHVAENHHSATFEAVTGYMPAEFSSFSSLDMNTYAVTALDQSPGEIGQPVVMSTADGSHAMGAYMPDTYGVGSLSYAKYAFPGTVKWSVVLRRGDTPAAAYNFRTLIAVGNLTQVRATLMQLDMQLHPGKVAAPTVQPAGFFTLDGRGIYYSNGGDAYCPVPNPSTFAAMGGDPNLRNVGVVPGLPSAMRQDGPCGQAPAGAQAGALAPLHRFFNPASGEHVLTGDFNELASTGIYQYEGIAFSVSPTALGGTHPIYRCYTGGSHFVSLVADCEGQTVEGLFGFINDQPAPDRVPLYRLYNPRTGDHLSTKNVAEGASVGYVSEGLQGYVL